MRSNWQTPIDWSHARAHRAIEAAQQAALTMLAQASPDDLLKLIAPGRTVQELQDAQRCIVLTRQQVRGRLHQEAR